MGHLQFPQPCCESSFAPERCQETRSARVGRDTAHPSQEAVYLFWRNGLCSLHTPAHALQPHKVRARVSLQKYQTSFYAWLESNFLYFQLLFQTISLHSETFFIIMIREMGVSINFCTDYAPFSYFHFFKRKL